MNNKLIASIAGTVLMFSLIAYGNHTIKEEENRKWAEQKAEDNRKIESSYALEAAKELLTISLNNINDTLRLCADATTTCRYKTDSMIDLINTMQQQVASDSTAMINYFAEHKMAVACIIAGEVSAKVKGDFVNQYPESVEKAASWGLVASLAYYLFNADEVEQVNSRANDAAENRKSIYTSIERYYRELEVEKNNLSAIANMESRYQQKAANIKMQLSALGYGNSNHD